MQLRVLMDKGDVLVNIAKTIDKFNLPLHKESDAIKCIKAIQRSDLSYEHLYYIPENGKIILKYRGLQNA